MTQSLEALAISPQRSSSNSTSPNLNPTAASLAGINASMLGASPHRSVVLQKSSVSTTPSKMLEHLTVAQIAKKFDLISNFETLEGHENLSHKELLSLLEYSSVLAKD
jgi:hypothetical protein